jgi:hypothetical protein
MCWRGAVDERRPSLCARADAPEEAGGAAAFGSSRNAASAVQIEVTN